LFGVLDLWGVETGVGVFMCFGGWGDIFSHAEIAILSKKGHGEKVLSQKTVPFEMTPFCL
jgi:hypothetical protein